MSTQSLIVTSANNLFITQDYETKRRKPLKYTPHISAPVKLRSKISYRGNLWTPNLDRVISASGTINNDPDLIDDVDDVITMLRSNVINETDSYFSELLESYPNFNGNAPKFFLNMVQLAKWHLYKDKSTAGQELFSQWKYNEFFTRSALINVIDAYRAKNRNLTFHQAFHLILKNESHRSLLYTLVIADFAKESSYIDDLLAISKMNEENKKSLKYNILALDATNVPAGQSFVPDVKIDNLDELLNNKLKVFDVHDHDPTYPLGSMVVTASMPGIKTSEYDAHAFAEAEVKKLDAVSYPWVAPATVADEGTNDDDLEVVMSKEVQTPNTMPIKGSYRGPVVKYRDHLEHTPNPEINDESLL